jgi:hypothetical protein
MKRIIPVAGLLSIALGIVVTTATAQKVPDYDNVKLSEAADYKTADGTALQAATYVLSVPLSKDDSDRLKSIQFIIKWMSGTPDYTFTLDGVIEKVTKGNDEMLGVYMAAMTKYALEHPDQAKDPKVVKLNAVMLLLDYCENPAYKVKSTESLKKLLDARNKGELEKEL